jgi:hypothetical protein
MVMPNFKYFFLRINKYKNRQNLFFKLFFYIVSNIFFQLKSLNLLRKKKFPLTTVDL